METPRPVPQARARTSSTTTTNSSRRRKHRSGPNARKVTTDSYILAYPAPVFTNNTLVVKHLRARLYLQLQHISQDKQHHTPFIDVISLGPKRTAHEGMLSRIKTCVNCLSCGMHFVQLNKRDILVVDSIQETPRSHSQSDSISEPEVYTGSESENSTKRSVLAVLRADNDIATKSGEIWTASERLNTYFEFVTINAHGMRSVARWVVSKSHKHVWRTSAEGSSPSSSPGHVNETSFHFSLIDPTVRRHAVLATLSSSGLDVKKTYQNPRSISSGSEDEGGQVHVVDAATKNLILATAVWLILNLGWSPVYEANRKQSHGE